MSVTQYSEGGGKKLLQVQDHSGPSSEYWDSQDYIRQNQTQKQAKGSVNMKNIAQ